MLVLTPKHFYKSLFYQKKSHLPLFFHLLRSLSNLSLTLLRSDPDSHKVVSMFIENVQVNEMKVISLFIFPIETAGRPAV